MAFAQAMLFFSQIFMGCNHSSLFSDFESNRSSLLLSNMVSFIRGFILCRNIPREDRDGLWDEEVLEGVREKVN